MLIIYYSCYILSINSINYFILYIKYNKIFKTKNLNLNTKVYYYNIKYTLNF